VNLDAVSLRKKAENYPEGPFGSFPGVLGEGSLTPPELAPSSERFSGEKAPSAWNTSKRRNVSRASGRRASGKENFSKRNTISDRKERRGGPGKKKS